MISKACCFVVLGLILAISEGQIGVSNKCPVCADPYDHTTCTTTTDCYNTEDICEMQVDTGDKNKINFFCLHEHACSNHENHRCEPTKMDVCSFCCKTVDDCKTLRENLFATKFAGASGNSTSP